MTLFSHNPTKILLLEMLKFLYQKVDTDQCTAEEIQKFADVATTQLDVLATTKDIAEFYGESESNVRNILARRVIPKEHKPKRKVYFSFNLFASRKPNSWKRKEERI